MPLTTQGSFTRKYLPGGVNYTTRTNIWNYVKGKVYQMQHWTNKYANSKHIGKPHVQTVLNMCTTRSVTQTFGLIFVSPCSLPSSDARNNHEIMHRSRNGKVAFHDRTQTNPCLSKLQYYITLQCKNRFFRTTAVWISSLIHALH